MKGGEVEYYTKYIAAVSGVAADVQDVSDVDAVVAYAVSWLKSEEGGLRWGVNAAKCVGILVAFFFLSLIGGRLAHRATGMARNISVLLRNFLTRMVRWTILAVGLIVGVSALGVEVGPVLALIGAVGFIVAFALQGTLSNFASGLMILMYKPYDVGNAVNVAGVAG